jgi:large subunit ribosomal protein L21
MRVSRGEEKLEDGMKYAIIETGGKQYLVREGETVEIDRLPLQIGDAVKWNDVLLLVDDGQVSVGNPLVKGASVKGKVLDQVKGSKILVFKYIPKERYRRRRGHRQQYTRVEVEKIALSQPKKQPAASEEKKKTETAPKKRTSTSKASGKTTETKAKA